MADPTLLEPINKTPLTDAAPVYTTIQKVDGRLILDLLVDIVADKGCTCVITPIPNGADPATLGLASATGTIADGGGAGRFSYADLNAPAAKIVITKTEAGDMTAFTLAVRGRV